MLFILYYFNGIKIYIIAKFRLRNCLNIARIEKIFSFMIKQKQSIIFFKNNTMLKMFINTTDSMHF